MHGRLRRSQFQAPIRCCCNATGLNQFFDSSRHGTQGNARLFSHSRLTHYGKLAWAQGALKIGKQFGGVAAAFSSFCEAPAILSLLTLVFFVAAFFLGLATTSV